MAWIDVPQATGAQRAALARAQAGTTASGTPRWYSIRNDADADEAEVMIYDSIGGWFGVYADEFIDELRGITAPKMRVRINSPGGSVFEGIAIANALRAHPATVTVQVDGLAASIASVIAMAGDRIEMAPNSMLMIHEASGACLGDAAEMEKMAEVLDLISTNIAGAYAARTGGTAAEWRAAMRAETWYLPDAAVAAGLADEALSAVPESAAAPEQPDEEEAEDDELLEARLHAQWDLAAYGYAGPPQPERPKPAPPAAPTAAAEAQPAPTLVISIADVLDEGLVARLRAAVTNVSPPAVGTGHGETPTAAASAAPPEAPAAAATTEPTDSEPGPDDPWANQIAHLTAPNDWAAATQHLTTPAAPAATAA